MDFQKQQISNFFIKYKVESLLLSAPDSFFWYSNVKIDDAQILITPSKSYFFTDNSYATYLNNHQNIKNIDEIIIIENYQDNLFKHIMDILINQKILTLSFDNENSIKNFFLMEKYFAKKIKLAAISLDNLYMEKSPKDIENIKRGCKILAQGIDYMKKWLQPGITEKAAALELNNYFLSFPDVEKLSFDTIMAFGSNSALPHAIPTENKLKFNDIVLIDCGVVINGYCSDQTRTFFINKPNEQLAEIYKIVLEGQKIAINMVKPGIAINTLDKAVRDYFKSKNYDKYFIHNLGHGLGIHIHEKPFLSSNNKEALQLNSVITIEPGIYIEGLGGIRIEDDLYIIKNGYEILNICPKELEIIQK